MIDSLRGDLLEKATSHCVVDCHGVGYLVHVPLGVYTELPERGAVRLYIHYSVSVDVRSGLSEP
jgi:Holliday junction DNA helicase RuvA